MARLYGHQIGEIEFQLKKCKFGKVIYQMFGLQIANKLL